MGILSIKLGARSRLLDRAGVGAPAKPQTSEPLALPGERRLARGEAIRLVVSGNPLPWERVQAQTKKGRAIFFTARRTRQHQAKIQDAARLAGVRPLAGPVKLVVSFYRATRQRCDVDNLSKSVQDALNGIAYGDDSQIVALVAVKALDPANPRTEIVVSGVA